MRIMGLILVLVLIALAVYMIVRAVSARSARKWEVDIQQIEGDTAVVLTRGSREIIVDTIEKPKPGDDELDYLMELDYALDQADIRRDRLNK